MHDRETYSQWIKSEARRLGFYDCGIAEATHLTNEANNLASWLKEHRHGEMHYMENYLEKRLDPRKLVEGAKSVISVLFNYYPNQQQPGDTYKISKYAYGKDYHFIVKDKLRSLLEFIQEHISTVNGRVFVDSAPVMDKVWAQRAGLGWIGKNTNLINKEQGSFFFIGEIILDLELIYDAPAKDHCGNCHKCIDACPAGALTAPYQIDASKCISYLTIEKRGELNPSEQTELNGWVFGCDVCQDVCPWNQHSKPHQHEELKPHPELFTLSKRDWKILSKEKFNQLFKKSAVKRAKYQGIMRNISVQENQGETDNSNA